MPNLKTKMPLFYELPKEATVEIVSTTGSIPLTQKFAYHYARSSRNFVPVVSAKPSNKNLWDHLQET